MPAAAPPPEKQRAASGGYDSPSAASSSVAPTPPAGTTEVGKEASHVLALRATSLGDILEIKTRQHRVDGARVQLEPCFGELGAASLVDGDHHGQHERISADGVALGIDQLLDMRSQLACGAYKGEPSSAARASATSSSGERILLWEAKSW